METTFQYSVQDLVSYLNFAHSLWEDLVAKFERVLKSKDWFLVLYGERATNTSKIIQMTAEKLKFLELKLQRLEQEVEEETIEELIDECLEIQGDTKVVEIDQDTQTSSQYKSLNSMDTTTLSDGPKFTSKSLWRSKTNDLKSAAFFIDKDKIDAKNFTSVLEKVVDVGINPTALFTEVLIKVLLKMEDSVNKLLVKPSNNEYSELFYRADYLKSYDVNLQDIIKMPDDDLFYVR